MAPETTPILLSSLLPGLAGRDADPSMVSGLRIDQTALALFELSASAPGRWQGSIRYPKAGVDIRVDPTTPDGILSVLERLGGGLECWTFRELAELAAGESSPVDPSQPETPVLATAGAPRPRKRDAGTSPEVAAPPSAQAGELTELERLQDLADDLTAQVAGLEKAAQGDAAAAAEIASLTRRLQTVESQRDVHMATSAELAQENKRLKRANATLRKSLDAARAGPTEATA